MKPYTVFAKRLYFMEVTAASPEEAAELAKQVNQWKATDPYWEVSKEGGRGNFEIYRVVSRESPLDSMNAEEIVVMAAEQEADEEEGAEVRSRFRHYLGVAYRAHPSVQYREVAKKALDLMRLEEEYLSIAVEIAKAGKAER